MDTTLVVLAAGMGSRYGGLKQMDAFGPSGETLLDYSIYDAIKSGFNKVVFVIGESFQKEFRSFFKGKFDDKIDIEYVYQRLEDIPDGFMSNRDRQKPWGTAHAVWVTRHVVDSPFVVINADDFYGRGAYQNIHKHLTRATKETYSLVGYRLDKTMSKHGKVNRGICETDEHNRLVSIVETLKIGFSDNHEIIYEEDDKIFTLHPNTTVSMNFWGFHPDYFDLCEQGFIEFLKTHGQELKSEYFIPILMENLIKSGRKEVDLITCDEEWFGVTYQEDKPFVQKRIQELISQGTYSKDLWA